MRLEGVARAQVERPLEGSVLPGLGCGCYAPPLCDGRAVLQKARLELRGDGRFSLSGRTVLPGPPALAPASDGLRLVVQDAAGGTLLDLAAAPGADWKHKGAGRWSFRDDAGAVSLASLRDRSAKTPGLVRVSLRGEAGPLALTAPAGLLSTLIFGRAAEACAALAWNAPEAPRPRCREKHGTLSCR